MARKQTSYQEKYSNMPLEKKSKELEKAFRMKCKECNCGSLKEALLCEIEGCPLNRFKFLLK